MTVNNYLGFLWDTGNKSERLQSEGQRKLGGSIDRKISFNFQKFLRKNIINPSQNFEEYPWGYQGGLMGSEKKICIKNNFNLENKGV